VIPVLGLTSASSLDRAKNHPWRVIGAEQAGP